MAVLAALRRNPIVFVPVLAWTFLRVPEFLLQQVNPYLAGFLSSGGSALVAFATPFFQAGLIGMADEALDGETSLATFVRAGREHYLPVFLVSLLLLAGNVLLAILLLVGILVGLAVLPGGGGPSAVPAFVGGVVALVLLGYLAALVLIQFYGHAIVLEGRQAIAGIRRSTALVRRNPTRTLGYSVVTGIAGLLFALGIFLSYVVVASRGSSWFGHPIPALSTGSAAVDLTLLALFKAAVAGAFATYSVAYYRRITD